MQKAYIKHCEESGVVMDGDILLNLEALAKSKTHDSRVHVSVSGHRVEVQDADQPLWRKQHPRIVQGTAGDSVHEPSRSLAIASLHSPMKTPLSDADFSVFKSQNDADAFQESPSMKATYNGFGPPIGMYHEMDSERTGVEIPLKKGGWPSPRFSSKGTPKPGMMKGSRFIVAPSTFIKPPRQKQVLDFYAAPVRFPVFRAAPVAMPTAVSSHVPAPLAAPAILTVETEDHNVIFSPRRPEGHAVGGDYSPGSPTSPIKARIAAAVASATAAAQNANSGGVPLDVEALMRSLAALGKELPLHGAVASQPKNQSRSDQHEARMRQLLHVLDPHLEHAYEAILGSRASEHSLKEAPKRVLSKKEKKVSAALQGACRKIVCN